MTKFFHAMLLPLIVFFAQSSYISSGEVANVATVASWQDYLNQRPVVYEIVFRQGRPSTQKDGKVLTNVIPYHGSWQPGSFFLEVQSIANMSNTPNNDGSISVVGIQNSRYWYINFKEIVEWQDTNNGGGQNNPISIKCKVDELTLLEVLNFGTRLLKNKSLRWSGNSFIANTDESMFFPPDEEKKHVGTIRGQILLNTNGLPDSLRFKKDGYKTEQVIYYGYSTDSDVPKYFPHHIVHKVVGTNGVEKLISETEIVRLSLSQTLLPVAHFEPERFISKFRLPPKYTNLTNDYYYRVANGKMTPILLPPKDGINFAEKRPERRYLIMFIASSLFATTTFVFYYVFNGSRKTTNK